VALVALALVEKVSRLELGRGKPGDDRNTYWLDELQAVQQLQENFSRLCSDDVLAYQRLARTAGVETNSEQRQAAVLGAIDCPRQMMRAVHGTLPITLAVGLRCRKHLVGDVLVAVELLGAALQGAHHIASANLSLLKQSGERQPLFEVLERDLNAGAHRLMSIREDLTARLTEAAPREVYVDPCC
jgi:formiminotetrahydrofolate cyclodeaminase